MKNVHYNIPQPKVTSSDVLFYPTNNLKPKDTQFTTMYDKEENQIFIYAEQEPANVGHFLKWIKQLIKFSVH